MKWIPKFVSDYLDGSQGESGQKDNSGDRRPSQNTLGERVGTVQEGVIRQVQATMAKTGSILVAMATKGAHSSAFANPTARFTTTVSARVRNSFARRNRPRFSSLTTPTGACA